MAPFGDGVLGMGKIARNAFFPNPPQTTAIIATIIDFAGRARREGILSLQNVSNESKISRGTRTPKTS